MTDNPNALLRRQLRQARRALSPAQRISAAQALATHLLALPCAPQQGAVAGYWACDGEIALNIWQMRLPEAVTYCLPVLAGQYLMFAPYRPGQPLRSNRYGIVEPDGDTLLPAEALQLIVIPLVGFDGQGNRLGMGGGWYDRTLRFRKQKAAPPYLVGVGFDVQRCVAFALQPWDVRPDMICTESGLL